MPIDLNEYKQLYLKTASDKLSEMTDLLSAVEQRHDPKAQADFHRLAHSIKSQSLVMGYYQLGLAGKILEALFRAVQKDQIKLDTNIFEIIKKTLNAMNQSLISIQSQQGELNLSHEIQSLEEHTKIRLLDP